MKCIDCHCEFAHEAADLEFVRQRWHFDLPDLCYKCRWRRRMAWRNEVGLFTRKCDATGKDIIATFPAYSPVTVYEYNYYFSDAWDPFAYGRELDITQSFYPQLKALLWSAPWPNVSQSPGCPSENSEYANYIGSCRNCYLLASAQASEDCMYCRGLHGSRDLLDCMLATKCELGYELRDCENLYHSFYCVHCFYSNDLYFCDNCRNCHDCAFCSNLRNKSYCLFNKQYNKEEYQKLWENLNFGDRRKLAEMRRDYSAFLKSQPYPHVFINNSEDCTGNYIEHAKGYRNSFLVKDGEDCREVFAWILDGKDSFGCVAYGMGSELLYETCSVRGYNIVVGYMVESCQDSYFLFNSLNCSHCFGCIGLKHAEYCIFNVQYTKEEYFAKVAEILSAMKERGEGVGFPPLWVVPFAYNYTLAQELFPLTQEESVAQGLQVNFDEQYPPRYEGTVRDLPDDIREVSDDLLRETLVCEQCHRPYNLQKKELEFYRAHQIPVPHECFFCRYRRRFQEIVHLFPVETACAKCGKSIQDYVQAGGGRPVYCEECFLQVLE